MRYEALIRRTFDVVGYNGEEFTCLCPWHGDTKTAHLYVNAVKGVYHCKSCHQKGHLASILTSLPPTTTEDLCARLSALRDSAETILIPHTDAWLNQYGTMHPMWTDPIPEGRGLSQDAVDRFDLGYDPLRDVLTIPVRNLEGHVLGVITRRIDNQRPKYKYPKGFPIGRYLFGAWLLKKEPHQVVALVEGPIDAVACWDARVPALGMMGARLTKDQTIALSRLGIRTAVIFTDNDDAGRDAILPVARTLQGTGIGVRVVTYRPYWRVKDPAAMNEQRRRKAFHSALPWHRYLEISSK